MCRIAFLGFVSLIAFASSITNAGGPLRFNQNGPVLWPTASPISYKTDRGPLGALSEADARNSVNAAFKAWTDVPTSKIEFKSDGLLPDDVDTAAEYLPLENGGANVVVFDTDGDIIASVAGPQNRFKILGWASPVTSSNNSRIDRFYSLMNGHFAFAANEFLSTLIHEFGHAVGLDHSQIHAPFAGNGIDTDDDFIPTMFPTNADDDIRLGSLNPDDIAWISMLYPDSNFDQKYGRIKGRLVQGNSSAAVRGANVIVFKVDGTNNDRLHERFSCVSDWLTKNNGEFIIPAKPGKYKLMIEPILPDFTGGSSVGPWAETVFSPSFVSPVTVKEFPDEIEVQAGNTVDLDKLKVD